MKSFTLLFLVDRFFPLIEFIPFSRIVCDGTPTRIELRLKLICFIFAFPGVHDEWYVKNFKQPDFYAKISDDVNKDYKKNYGMNVSEYIDSKLLEYIGKPVDRMIK